MHPLNGCGDPKSSDLTQYIVEIKKYNNYDISFTEYLCHGSWTDNDTTFIIARHVGTKHGVCISFKPSTTDSTAAQLIVGDSCYREATSLEIPEHHLISNVTGVVREYHSGYCAMLHFNYCSYCTAWKKREKMDLISSLGLLSGMNKF